MQEIRPRQSVGSQVLQNLKAVDIVVQPVLEPAIDRLKAKRRSSMRVPSCRLVQVALLLDRTRRNLAHQEVKTQGLKRTEMNEYAARVKRVALCHSASDQRQRHVRIRALSAVGAASNV